MRVGYVCTDPGVPVFGSKGASVHVQAVVRALLRRGDDVVVVAARTGGDPPADLAGVPVRLLPAVRRGEPAEREQAQQAADAAVARLLDEAGPVDLIYERYALWGRTATAWAASRGVPSVLEVNAPLVEEQAQHRALVDRPAAEDVARSALSQAGTVVCVSEAVAAWARRRSARPGRVHVVGNGVDADRIRPPGRPVTAAGAAPFVLGFVGTLKPWHGVATLVEALALLDRSDPGGYRLLLVGDGPERASVLRLAEHLGVGPAVEHVGAVAPDAVGPLLHRMDVGVAPYPPLPGFYFSPLKVVEYLAAGLPVVASRLGQVPGLLAGGALGALVEPGDPGDLARAVAALRADEPRRRALRAQARAAVLAGHTWDAVVDRVLAASTGLAA